MGNYLGLWHDSGNSLLDFVKQIVGRQDGPGRRHKHIDIDKTLRASAAGSQIGVINPALLE